MMRKAVSTMGPLHSSAFPNSLRATAKACSAPGTAAKRPRSAFKAVLAASAAAFVAGCISDGPNHTGGAYLANQGILLSNPLYHVKLPAFPADSFWTTELEPGHLGDSILLAGRKGHWYAEPRFTFNISDTALLDSLSQADSLPRSEDISLRLSLASPIIGNGISQLKAFVGGGEGPVLDSARFAAKAWVWNDSGIAADKWKDSIRVWNRRFLLRGDTVVHSGGTGSVTPPTTIDTLTLGIKSAYSGNGQQLRALPGLRKVLAKGRNRRHIVHIRLALLPDPGTDSASSMLRLGGDWGTGATFDQGPQLLFGKPKPVPTLKDRLPPLDAGNGTRGVNYSLRYDGPRNHILNAKIRGLHVTFDRDRFLDSIEAALKRQGITPPPRTNDPLSLAWFVPFAKMSLPIDSAVLEGRFPLPVNLKSMTDTLLGDTLEGGIGEYRLRDGDVKPDLWTVSELGRPDVIRNQVGLAYKAIDKTLNRVILTWSKDSSANDTLYIRDGETRQWNWNGSSSKRTVNMVLEAKNPFLTVRHWMVVRSGFEYNELRDTATGKPIDELAKKVPRFIKPGDKAITLRATGGIQALLNRTDLGTSALQDFQFEPAYRAVNDTAKNAFGNAVGMELSYPVLDVIAPKIDSAGGLTVDLEFYLYPLRAR